MAQLYPSQFGPVYSAPVFVEGGRDKAQTRRKYVFTDQIDQLIREIYLNHRDAKTGVGTRPLAKKAGMAALGAEEACPRTGVGANQRAAMEREGTGDSGAVRVDERRANP
ncbi:MAG TPA: hypothetical protein VN620_14910, partial [Candidatus Methylomirabilis sp.]|nr:hypothetical protein [Candidatus Methylomirabilis sp.]